MKFRNIMAMVTSMLLFFNTVAYANSINTEDIEINLEISLDDLQLEFPSEMAEETEIGFFSAEEVQQGLSLIKGTYPWDLMAYGNDIKIAVIDSGCSSHTDLSGQILEGWNYVSGTTDVTDEDGHGTHVSGIIAALSNDAGVVGFAPKAKVVPLKAQGINSEGKTSFSVSNAMQAVVDAVDKYDCDVISMSWGITETSIIDSITIQKKAALVKALVEKIHCSQEEAVKYFEENETGKETLKRNVDAYYAAYVAEMQRHIDHAYNKGAMLIAAVGNNTKETLNYPAGLKNVIGVSSVGTDQGEKELSAFSNYNSSAFVCAPGYKIKSTHLSNNYKEMSGTSQATPYVSGLAAIAKSINPNITQDEFKQLLIDTSEDLGDEGYDVKYGYGLVNAQALVEKMIENTVYISPINTDKDGCSALIYNNTDKKATGISIWAEYGDALSVFNTPVSVEIEKGEKKTVEYDKLPGAKLKHFLWSDMNTLEPLGISRAYGE